MCPMSMETTRPLENQNQPPPPTMEEPQGSLQTLCCLKEYPNYLCNQIESCILLCLLGYDHRPIDNRPLLTP